jgi:hypothetical protein
VATDILYGYGGDDTLSGGGGFDTLYGGADHDWLRGEDGADTLYGETGNVILEGHLGNDYLDAGNGSNSLYGGDGDDILVSGSGDDWMHGGAGFDIVDYRFGTGRVEIDLTKGAGRVGTEPVDTLISIEGVSGSNYNDNLMGDGLANNLFGRGGHDVLRGNGGDDFNPSDGQWCRRQGRRHPPPLPCPFNTGTCRGIDVVQSARPFRRRTDNPSSRTSPTFSHLECGIGPVTRALIRGLGDRLHGHLDPACTFLRLCRGR